MSEKIKLLEVFENQYPDRDYNVIHEAPEFTSVCPKTGQPDFAAITIEYIPDKLCIELKSLKFYLNSYRNDGIYFESVTNKILDDLVEVCQPRFMRITAEFNVRGGISSTVEVEYSKDDFYTENYN
jgi:7-cyano-7-deazaguanine reductase